MKSIENLAMEEDLTSSLSVAMPELPPKAEDEYKEMESRNSHNMKVKDAVSDTVADGIITNDSLEDALNQQLAEIEEEEEKEAEGELGKDEGHDKPAHKINTSDETITEDESSLDNDYEIDGSISDIDKVLESDDDEMTDQGVTIEEISQGESDLEEAEAEPEKEAAVNDVEESVQNKTEDKPESVQNETEEELETIEMETEEEPEEIMNKTEAEHKIAQKESEAEPEPVVNETEVVPEKESSLEPFVTPLEETSGGNSVKLDLIYNLAPNDSMLLASKADPAAKTELKLEEGLNDLTRILQSFKNLDEDLADKDKSGNFSLTPGRAKSWEYL
jgi:hypothetical protein